MLGCFETKFAQVVFPELCVVCGKRILHKQTYADLCTACCASLPWRRVHERLLPLLTWRFKLQGSKEQRLLEQQLFCLLAFHYRGAIPALLRSLKFGNRLANATPLGQILGDLIARELVQRNEENWCVTAVPLSQKRQRSRAYNQAEMIAIAAAERAGLAYVTLLAKKKDLARQSEFRFEERLDNVVEAFRLTEKVEGKRIVLIDDILTSGATLFEAGKTLLQAGACEVLCAAVASGRKTEVQDRNSCMGQKQSITKVLTRITASDNYFDD